LISILYFAVKGEKMATQTDLLKCVVSTFLILETLSNFIILGMLFGKETKEK